MSLISSARGVDRVLPLHDGVPDVEFDCDIEIMELAHALRVDAQAIVCPVPYLFPKLPTRLQPPGRSELSVGLVWCAGNWDSRRSLPAQCLAPLSRVAGARLYSLQRGPAAAEAESIPAHDISTDDVEVAAAALQTLDLLISVDTFAAHLAGALGIPVWLLLHSQCDWRWMDRCSNSIWYPTMRLFRQARAGDWLPVIRDVAADLQTLADQHASRMFGTNMCM
jgi:hypothetical protein